MGTLKRNGYTPREPKPFVHRGRGVSATLSSKTKLTPEELDARGETAMRNSVMLAISNAVEARSGYEFERDVERYRIAGCVMGDKQSSRHFPEKSSS
jgi:hypothetical protein